jgi:hypothetical protein
MSKGKRGGRYGSNSSELCPVCFVVLRTRMSAVSHYRAHVRSGVLMGHPQPTKADPDKLPRYFKLIEDTDVPDHWWDRGPVVGITSGEVHAYIWQRKHHLIDWYVHTYMPWSNEQARIKRDAEEKAVQERLVNWATDHLEQASLYLHVDYSVPEQSTYRAMQLKIYGNHTTAVLVQFATGDPVADYDAARQYVQDHGVELMWGPSNLVDWLCQGEGYSIKADSKLVKRGEL